MTVALALAGCAAAPAREPLPLDAVPVLSSTEGAALQDRWWSSFDDPVLAAHIERGLGSSFTLRAAYQRLKAANAIAAREEAALSPTVNAFGDGALREEFGDDDGNVQESQVGLGLEASYEVDLWGRIRDGIEAQQLEAEATAEDYQAAAVSLSAAVAVATYRLTETAAQLALIESQLRTNRDVLEVIESRFAIGQSGSADVLRQRALVEATNEQRIIELASFELLEHQLAVLQGRPPQGVPDLAPPEALPPLPEVPEIGLPADVLQRRPDVRSAYLRLESADASVAAAVKDQYPRVDLAASFTTSGEDFSDLFSSWVGTLAGLIVAPLVDGGLRRSEIDRAVAVRRQRLAEYGDAVLFAFQEVEDALTLENRQSDRIASLERQLALANSTYTELRNQYLNGAADFIDVLVALRNQQDLERSLLEASLLRIEARIALHRAVAGGFAGPPPDEAQDEPEPRP